MIRQKVIDNYRDMVASLKTELKLAEAEVERLKTENAKLRKVVEAAREFVGCPCEDDGTAECAECTAYNYRQALAELDKEGE